MSAMAARTPRRPSSGTPRLFPLKEPPEDILVRVDVGLVGDGRAVEALQGATRALAADAAPIAHSPARSDPPDPLAGQDAGAVVGHQHSLPLDIEGAIGPHHRRKG